MPIFINKRVENMNNKGLTYRNLIIIIILILVIIAILLFNAFETYNTSEIGEFINDMELLEEKVNYINEEYLLWEDYDPNEGGNFSSYLQSKKFVNANSASNIYIEEFEKIIEELNNSNLDNWNQNLDQILSNYCYFTPSSIAENFNIEINYYVIINFYTGNIICKDGINYNGKLFYRHYDLKENFGIKTTYQKEVIPKIEVVENNGLNKKIKVSFENNENNPNIAEIYYLVGETDEDKKRCTEISDYQYIAEEKSAYFTINISGKYEFIVEDTKYSQYPKISIDISLCNKPILEDGMQGVYFDENNNEILINSISDKNWYNYSENNFKPAYAKKADGSYWIWVPRFIYRKLQNDIKVDFVYNISQTSTTNKSTINYKLPKTFDNDDSGIWIREENFNYYNTQSADFFKKLLTNE